MSSWLATMDGITKEIQKIVPQENRAYRYSATQRGQKFIELHFNSACLMTSQDVF